MELDNVLEAYFNEKLASLEFSETSQINDDLQIFLQKLLTSEHFTKA